MLPILARACFDCHGVDVQESALRLDVQQVPSLAASSSAPRSFPATRPAVRSSSSSRARANLEMPPAGAKLTAEEVAVIRQWIDAGAHWPGPADQPVTAPLKSDHWSLQPLAPIEPPVSDDPWGATGVDAFVLAKLTTRASRRRRRPTAARSFAGSTSTCSACRRRRRKSPRSSPTIDPHAYDDLVDRVLASPRYGERWAQHWLDVVRFAETNGFETNVERQNAWPYRDYVIAAFNDDKPYDQFVAEQLAGDALGDAGRHWLPRRRTVGPGEEPRRRR